MVFWMNGWTDVWFLQWMAEWINRGLVELIAMAMDIELGLCHHCSYYFF